MRQSVGEVASLAPPEPFHQTTLYWGPVSLTGYTSLQADYMASGSIGTIQRRLAWPLRKDGMNKSLEPLSSCS